MTDSTLTFLDSYCERAGDAGMFAEPLNAITNLAFIVAAVLVARALRRLPNHKFSAVGDIWLLALALFSIGIGSGLWHTYARAETMLADVIPIAIFINIYLLAALRRLFALNWWKVVLWWVVYQAIGTAAQIYLPPDTLHGTVMYIPTFAALAVITALLQKRGAPAAKPFTQVLLVWSLSLIFRTIDLEICHIFPLGTHFLWHLLNAWVLWRLSLVLIESSRQRTNS